MSSEQVFQPEEISVPMVSARFTDAVSGEFKGLRYFDKGLYVSDQEILNVGRHAAKHTVLLLTVNSPDELVTHDEFKLHKIRSAISIISAVGDINKKTSKHFGYQPWEAVMDNESRGTKLNGIIFHTAAKVEEQNEKPALVELYTDLRSMTKPPEADMRDSENWSKHILRNGLDDMPFLVNSMFTDLDRMVLHRLVTTSGPGGITIREMKSLVDKEVGQSGRKVRVGEVIESLERIAIACKKSEKLEWRLSTIRVPSNDPLESRRLIWHPRSQRLSSVEELLG